jgi:hypothetical protein
MADSWWDRLGAYAQGLNDFPAVAVDLTTKGPRSDFGYTLMNLMNDSATPIDVYPPDEMDFSGLGG